MLAEISPVNYFIFWMVFLGTLLGLAFFAWFGWLMVWKKIDLSPYSGLPLRYGRDIGYYQSELIYHFLFDMGQYDNRMFDLAKASFCRETGRIFPDSITWLDSIRVDWGFLQKRLPGNYVSWGSLTEAQQKDIRKKHSSLQGFQTALSSTNPNPRFIEPEFAYAKPGPLVVDVTNGTLVGWKEVPGTPFEVLVVQKPLILTYQKAPDQ